VSLEALSQHTTIGWDVDGTLVNSLPAERLHSFIQNNPQKRHCLVTFRTHGLIATLERDMAAAGFRDLSLFDKVLSIPPDMWLQWALAAQRRKEGKLIGKLLLPETAYMEWKGFACRQEGLTALVDDDMVNTKRGCERYKVALFDTNCL
jgi:hypothetical protein